MKWTAFIVAATTLGACTQTTTRTVEERPMTAIEALDIAQTDATCSQGKLGDARRFVLCEDGALRRESVEVALAANADPTLDIAAIAKKYDRVTQDFSGIEVATYGSITPNERPIAAGDIDPSFGALERESVRIDGTLFDVYLLESGDNSGMIFVERVAAN